MKKIQPKIFIDITIDLNDGSHDLSSGYSIGQIVHFNDTGEEYLHKNNNEWVNVSLSAWEILPSITVDTIKYGRLYNWYAVHDSRGIAPDGWHVPTYAEMTTLYNFIGGSNGGGNLKQTGTSNWTSPNGNATDLYGFRALPAGYYGSYYHAYNGINNYTNFWTSNSGYTGTAYYLSLNYYDGRTGIYQNGFNEGASIRCIRDEGNTATTAVDLDGNNYTSVTIGTQTWLVENLATTYYNNGDPISTTFMDGTNGAYGNYNNDERYVFGTTVIEDNSLYIQPTNNRKVILESIKDINKLVTGSTNSSDGNIPLFDGVSGNLLKDSGLSISGLSQNIVNSIDQSKWEDVPPVLGSVFEGGYIGYVLQSGDTGYDANYWKGIIIGTPSDNVMDFSPNGTNGVTGYQIGTGLNNTNSLIDILGSNAVAATYADSLILSGYTDWFIPSQGELLSFDNLLIQLGITGKTFYSSSESSANYVYGLAWNETQYATTGLIKQAEIPPVNLEFPSSVLPCRYFSYPRVYIKPKNNKRINVNIIDGLTPQNISLGKSGVNTSPSPQRFRWITDKVVSNVLLTDNCSSISVQIGGTTYNETTLVGVTLPAFTDLVILDLAIQTGYDNANAIIIF